MDNTPVIIKANTAGALETLLKETYKITQNNMKIQIVESSVGALSEADITNAT
jgi:translation initiation factor IF-2